MKLADLKIFILIFTSISFANTPSHSQQVLQYEPHIVTLTGILGTRIYPGPPNYESIKSGDRAERIWHVKLKRPFTVVGDLDPTSQNEKETGIREIQLIVISDKLGENLRKHMGATILFRGTLTHAITGHHHLPILMEVKSFVVQKE